MSEPRINSRNKTSKSTSIEGSLESVQSSSGLKDQNLNDEPKKKRPRFSFYEKKKILEESSVQTNEYICDRYKINQRTLKKWKAKKEKIYEAAENSSMLKKKKMINVSKEIDDALYLWLLNSVSSGTPVTGPIIQRKALILNAELGGNPDFKASNGWFQKWKQRKNVRSKMITGEKLSADPVAADEFKETFKKITVTKQLSRSQWFNMDESSLQYRAMPTRTFAPKEVLDVSGTKKQMVRVTIAACCNADGSFKLPPIVIGTANKPRALKNFNMEQLPVWYRSQKNGWMDKTIFEEWFTQQFVPKVKAFLASKNLPRIAALLVDNCRSHMYLHVDGIEIVFLPPNVTSLIQPLDQGIIQAWKLHYKRMLVDSILEAQEKSISLVDHLKTISVKDAIFWASESWDLIDSSTIYKCWNKCWPVPKKDASTQTEDDEAPALLDSSVGTVNVDSPVQINNHNTKNLFGVIKKIYGYEEVNEETVSAWLNEKNEARDWKTYNDQEIIEQVRAPSQSNDFESHAAEKNEMHVPDETIDFEGLSDAFRMLSELHSENQ